MDYDKMISDLTREVQDQRSLVNQDATLNQALDTALGALIIARYRINPDTEVMA